MLTLETLILIIFAFRVTCCAEFSFSKNANNYGPYTIATRQYQPCQGPKPRDVTVIKAELYNNETSSLVTFNTTFQAAAKMTEIKVQVYRMNGDQKSVLWNYKINKPCQHFAVTNIMAMYMPLQNNCIFKKGDMHLILDFTAVAQQFFGSSFFYGEFMYKVVILANQGNIMCFVTVIEFKKKKVT